MPSIHLEELTSFGRLAVKLDTDLTSLSRLSGQIQRLDLESDSGLERSVKLLTQFAEQGAQISEAIQAFSRVLQEAHQRSEAAARLVADRAQVIGERKRQQREIQEKLSRLEEQMAAANANLAGFRKDGRSEFSAEEKGRIRAELERLNGDLKRFLADAQAVKDEAGRSKFKGIERNAQTLLDALRSTGRRVDKVLSGQ